MADFKKLRGSRLGPPPNPAEAPKNLDQPEVAPSDGRSARATGRTMQLATRVHPEFYREIRMYAAQHGLKLVEVLERGHEALKEKDQRSG